MKIYLNAFLDNNLGDDLMVLELANRFEDCQFYITSDNTTIRNTYKNITNINFIHKSDQRKCINECEIYLTLGGSMYQMKTLKAQLYSIVKTIRYAGLKLKGKKIVSLGSNLGPFRNMVSKLLLNIEFSLLDLNTVRDKESLAILDKFKFLRNYKLFEDIVFSSELVQNLSMTRNISKGNNHKVVGVSTYRSIYNPDINFDSYTYLSEVIKELLKEQDLIVKLFPFDSENENDLAAAHHVHSLVENSTRVEIIPYLGNYDTFLSELSSADSFIAIRFHSAILSELFNIPYFPICYSNKMENLLKDSGYNQEYVQFDNLLERKDYSVVANNLIDNKELCYGPSDLSDKRNNSRGHFNSLEEIINKKEGIIMNEKYTVLMSLYVKETPENFKQAVESVLNQSVLPDQIVIVLDGPLTEELDTELTEYRKKLLFDIVPLPKNVGLGPALNEGLKHCRNNLVARMDTDDICDYYRFEKQLKIFYNNSNVAIIGSNVSEFIDDPKVIVSYKKVPERHRQILKYSKIRCPFNHPTVMYKKNVVDSIGGYRDVPLFEDYDLWLRILSTRFESFNIQEDLVSMRTTPELYHRRGGFTYAKRIHTFRYNAYKSGYISFFDFVISAYPHMVVAYLPNKTREYIYRKILRSVA